MRLGVVFSPANDWNGIVAGARLADDLGLESVGFWDHYHSERPDWGYIVGWSAYGYLAAITDRVRLVPMVLCNINHALGVLAKESSVLSIASGGRFELAIGAGDYPVEYRMWHQPFPDATTRLELLEETVRALRELWTGELVTFEGRHVTLTDACSAPPPPSAPRVVAGVGKSRRMIESAVEYADELNVYADLPTIEYARQRIAAARRDIPISLYRHYEWDAWPDDLAADLAPWRDAGVTRAIVNVGFGWDKPARVRELAAAQEDLTGAAAAAAGAPA